MSYIIGNLLGRLLASYLIVLGFNLLTQRFRFRESLQKTHSLWGVVSITVILILGILGSLV